MRDSHKTENVQEFSGSLQQFLVLWYLTRQDAQFCLCVCEQVSELVKLPALAKPRVVLSITDLTLSLGRRVAAKAISAL